MLVRLRRICLRHGLSVFSEYPPARPSTTFGRVPTRLYLFGQVRAGSNTLHGQTKFVHATLRFWNLPFTPVPNGTFGLVGFNFDVLQTLKFQNDRNQISPYSFNAFCSCFSCSSLILQRGSLISPLSLPINFIAVFTGIGFVSINIALHIGKRLLCIF